MRITFQVFSGILVGVGRIVPAVHLVPPKLYPGNVLDLGDFFSFSLESSSGRVETRMVVFNTSYLVVPALVRGFTTVL